MLWILLALTAATCFALSSLIGKAIMVEASTLEYASVYSVLSAVFLLPVFLYFFPGMMFSAAPSAWAAFTVSGLANTTALMTFSKSLKTGEVSVVTPLVKTQPVFAALLGFTALGESLGLIKIAGIIMVTFGGYAVLLKKNEGILRPLRAVKTSVSAKLAILTAFLFATGAVADRFALSSFNPQVYTFMLLAFMATGIASYITLFERQKISEIKGSFRKHTKMYLLVGMVSAISYFTMVSALSLKPASKVVPIVQFQVLVAVAGGIIYFNEKGLKQKIAGSTILILGVVLIAAL